MLADSSLSNLRTRESSNVCGAADVLGCASGAASPLPRDSGPPAASTGD